MVVTTTAKEMAIKGMVLFETLLNPRFIFGLYLVSVTKT